MKWRFNKGFLVLFVLNVILFFVDFITTLMNKSIVEFVEINPLYHLFKSFWLVILLNVIVFFFLWYYYNKSKPKLRFVLIMCMVMLVLLRLTAVSNALSWKDVELTPEVMEDIEQRYTPEVRSLALKQQVITTYSPIFFCLIVFLVWSLDHKTRRKEE